MVQGVRQVYARMEGGLTLPDATYYWSADRSAVLDEYGFRMQELRMLARISAAAASSTAHDATHTHYTWFDTEWVVATAAVVFGTKRAAQLKRRSRLEEQRAPRCDDCQCPGLCA
jgi:predicted metalloendopeptidase